ncbi:ABC transporter permease [Verticiella sediminum]|uniref:ABC transporter permease n=1 Tax=Verticiella sediminum TaxID=1247510 RepID=A0A556ACF5_9BURK|nr:ABC transporter permease [Verticiella sediminum]TSH90560.1 ABC transporter permease [Verticiella sediminum]
MTSSALRRVLTARRPAREDYSATRRRWMLPALLLLGMFFVAPLVYNGWRSMTEEGAAADPLFYYAKLLGDPYYREVLWRTLYVSFTVTLLCLVASYPVAYFMVRRAGRWQPLIIFCLIAPLLTSIIMRTLGIRLLLARQGAFNAVLESVGLPSLPGWMASGVFPVYLGMIHVLIPFMVLSIAPVIQRIEPALEEAAGILGASKWRVFWHVTLPLSREGIYAGCILVFMLSNGSFVTQLLLGAGKMTTLPVLIFQQFNVTMDTAFAGAMGNVLLILTLGCLFVQSVLTGRRRG